MKYDNKKFSLTFPLWSRYENIKYENMNYENMKYENKKCSNIEHFIF